MYLHKQHASVQKERYQGLAKFNQGWEGRKRRGGGGGEGREGEKKKMTVKKVFLSNTLARLNCPESFSARACDAEAGLRGGEEQGPSFPATNEALARGGNMIRQSLVHRRAVIWGFVPFSLPRKAPRGGLMELFPACQVAPAPPAPISYQMLVGITRWVMFVPTSIPSICALNGELVAHSACPGGARGHPARVSPGKHKGASSSSSPGPWESAQHPAAPIRAALPSGMLGDSRAELTRAAAASCPSNFKAGVKVAKGKGFSSDSHQAL